MTENSEKRVFIRTYGCQMNVYDSERMSESLAKAGYAATDSDRNIGFCFFQFAPAT